MAWAFTSNGGVSLWMGTSRLALPQMSVLPRGNNRNGAARSSFNVPSGPKDSEVVPVLVPTAITAKLWLALRVRFSVSVVPGLPVPVVASFEQVNLNCATAAGASARVRVRARLRDAVRTGSISFMVCSSDRWVV